MFCGSRNIHTHHKEGYEKFQGGGLSKAKILKESANQNWNFWGCCWVQTKKHSMGGAWMFFETTYCEHRVNE